MPNRGRPRKLPTAREGLPEYYIPRVAGRAKGPIVTGEIRPTEWRWRNCRTYIVTTADGTEYRAVRVTSGLEFVGYWAVELLGLPL